MHDLVLLVDICQPKLPFNIELAEIAFVNKLLPRTRYPLGDWISEEEAIKSLSIAEKIYQELYCRKK